MFESRSTQVAHRSMGARSVGSRPTRWCLILAATALVSCIMPLVVVDGLHAKGSQKTASLGQAVGLSAAAAATRRFVAQAAKSVPWANAGSEGAPHMEMMGAAGAALVASVANELKLKKAELEGVGYTLAMSTASVAVQVNETRNELHATNGRLLMALNAIETLRNQIASLTEPWNGHAGEVRCANGHRCNNYVDAGKHNLTSITSVATCREYCSMAYPATNFFAFHNEHGWIAFMLDPKGRCRCYADSPCELVPDGGYTLWTSSSTCSADLRPAVPVAASNGGEQATTSL